MTTKGEKRRAADMRLVKTKAQVRILTMFWFEGSAEKVWASDGEHISGLFIWPMATNIQGLGHMLYENSSKNRAQASSFILEGWSAKILAWRVMPICCTEKKIVLKMCFTVLLDVR